MAKFVFYVIDLDEGTVVGSNNIEAIEKSGFLEVDNYLVLHQSGSYCLGDRTEYEVEQLRIDTTAEESDYEDD